MILLPLGPDSLYILPVVLHDSVARSRRRFIVHEMTGSQIYSIHGSVIEFGMNVRRRTVVGMHNELSPAERLWSLYDGQHDLLSASWLHNSFLIPPHSTHGTSSKSTLPPLRTGRQRVASTKVPATSVRGEVDVNPAVLACGPCRTHGAPAVSCAIIPRRDRVPTKAMVLSRIVSLDNVDTPLELVDLPVPEPGPGEVRIGVAAYVIPSSTRSRGRAMPGARQESEGIHSGV